MIDDYSPQSATSTLLTLFVKMSDGFYTPEEEEIMMQHHDQLHMKSRKLLKYDRSYTSEEGEPPFTFVFVRHPFDRLGLVHTHEVF